MSSLAEPQLAGEAETPQHGQTVPLIIIGILFFIFGFVTWLNGSLIPFLKIICELTTFQALLVTFVFYICLLHRLYGDGAADGEHPRAHRISQRHGAGLGGDGDRRAHPYSGGLFGQFRCVPHRIVHIGNGAYDPPNRVQSLHRPARPQ